MDICILVKYVFFHILLNYIIILKSRPISFERHIFKGARQNSKEVKKITLYNLSFAAFESNSMWKEKKWKPNIVLCQRQKLK